VAILVGTGLIELSVLSSIIAARVGTPLLLVQAIAPHTTAADRDDDAAPLALDEKGAARGLAAIPAVAQGTKNKAGNPVSRIQVSVVAGRECEMADLVRSQLAHFKDRPITASQKKARMPKPVRRHAGLTDKLSKTSCAAETATPDAG
jgi:hypothetical protein